MGIVWKSQNGHEYDSGDPQKRPASALHGWLRMLLGVLSCNRKMLEGGMQEAKVAKNRGKRAQHILHRTTDSQPTRRTLQRPLPSRNSSSIPAVRPRPSVVSPRPPVVSPRPKVNAKAGIPPRPSTARQSKSRSKTLRAHQHSVAQRPGKSTRRTTR